MNVWKKQTVRWTMNGKNVPSGTTGAEKETLYSKRFYGTLTVADGRKKQMPLMEDERASLKLLIRLQNEEDRKKFLGITDDDQKHLKPVSEALAEFISVLTLKGNLRQYVQATENQLKRLFKETKIQRLNELDSGKILKVMAKWKISLEAKNHYLRSAKAFTKWMIRERWLSVDPFIGLKCFNSNTDRRRVRRAFSEDELKTLLDVVGKSRKRYRGSDWQFLPVDRITLYRLAVSTGLRAKEISTLKVQDFNLETKTLTVQASNTKNKQTAILPITETLCELLPVFFQRLKTDRLFPGCWNNRRMAGRMLSRDLKRSGIPAIDSMGKVLDFHCLRYTFISNLAKGNVHPAKAQRLARHSDINLTMSVYTQLEVDDLREAVNVLPSF